MGLGTISRNQIGAIGVGRCGVAFGARCVVLVLIVPVRTIPSSERTVLSFIFKWLWNQNCRPFATRAGLKPAPTPSSTVIYLRPVAS